MTHICISGVTYERPYPQSAGGNMDGPEQQMAEYASCIWASPAKGSIEFVGLPDYMHPTEFQDPVVLALLNTRGKAIMQHVVND